MEATEQYKALPELTRTLRRLAIGIAIGGATIAAGVVEVVVLVSNVNGGFEGTAPIWVLWIIIAASSLSLFVITFTLTGLFVLQLRATSYHKRKGAYLEGLVHERLEAGERDLITGIPNTEVLKRDLDTADRKCLVLIDFCKFKKINKRFGYWRGDDYLRDMAKVLSDMVRRSEQAYSSRKLLGEGRSAFGTAYRRYPGGDEFYFLLSGGIADGMGFLLRLRNSTAIFEEVAQKALGQSWFKGFHAAVLDLSSVSSSGSYKKLTEEISARLNKAQDDRHRYVCWDDAEVPEPQRKRLVKEWNAQFARSQAPWAWR